MTPRVRLKVQSKRLIKLFAALVIFSFDRLRDLALRVIGIVPRYPDVIIYYHQVFPSDRVRFVRQMDHVVRCTRPAVISDLDSTPHPDRRIFVTADDGWLSFIENALPAMAARDVPLALFVISNRLGEALGDPGDRLITESELVALPQDLVTIGSHTATHIHLPEASADRIRWELSESRSRLSSMLGRNVNLFCFPFSMYDAESIRMCRAAGYLRAFGAPSTSMPDVPDSFFFQRVRVDPSDWPIEFHLKIMNAYRAVYFAAFLKRKVRGTLARTGPAAT